MFLLIFYLATHFTAAAYNLYILATQERVPCCAEKDLKDIGFLDPGSENVDLAKGTKLELPYWMVEVRKHSFSSLQL